MADKNIFYVYEHWRPDKNVCFYVGKGKGYRAYDMYARNKHHKMIAAKLTRSELAVEVKIVHSGLSEGDAYSKEKDRIAHYGLASLANLSPGGEGGVGYKHTTETREKMSLSQRKRGPRKPFSEEARRKIGAASKGRKARLGIKASEETKMKLRESGLAALPLFKKYSALGPKAMAKRVVCLDDGLIFESASAAARHYNVAKSAVIELCLGKKYRKTVGGLLFKYAAAI